MSPRCMVLWLLITGCRPPYEGPTEGEGASVHGHVVGLFGEAVAEAQVCDHETGDCTETDSQGAFFLDGLAVESDVIIEISAEDRLPTAYHHHTTSDEEWRKTLMPMSLVESMTEKVGSTWVPGTGHAIFNLWTEASYQSPRAKGVSFHVEPDGGLIFYQGAFGAVNPDDTATTGQGGAGAFNLEPGPVELVFSARCERWFSWDFEPGDPVPIEIIEGFGSYVDLVCEE